MTRLARIALVAWLVQPLYIVVELVIASRAREHYDLAADTISALGITTCRSAAHPHVCSPAHDWMNLAFVLFGAFVAIGALALPGLLASRGWLTRVVVALWFVGGLGSIGVGLVPIDHSSHLHYAVALPIFVARPVVLALTAVALRAERPALARVTWVATALTLAGVLGFGLGDHVHDLRGALERLALWPADIWFGTVAATTLFMRAPTD